MMQSVAVLSSTGKKLMPTNAYRARKLLKSGKGEHTQTALLVSAGRYCHLSGQEVRAL